MVILVLVILVLVFFCRLVSRHISVHPSARVRNSTSKRDERAQCELDLVLVMLLF